MATLNERKVSRALARLEKDERKKFKARLWGKQEERAGKREGRKKRRRKRSSTGE